MSLVKKIQQGLFLIPVNQYVQRVAATARKKAPTSRIQRNIAVIKPKVTQNGNVSTGIEVIAPEGRAYEYGSGEHATKGVKAKYPIVPRPENKTGLLAFRWDNAPAGIRPSKDGRYVFSRVMHPGVEAKPYIAPAIEENQDALSKRLLDRFGDVFVEEMEIVFNTAQRR